MFRVAVVLLSLANVATAAYGQQHEPSEPAGGPFTDRPVLNAPFSADAITTVRETLPGGNVRQHVVTAHYYRDSQGRVRAELETAWGPYVVLWLPREAAATPEAIYGFYDVDPVARTYWLSGHAFAKLVFNAEGRVALPVGRRVFRAARRVEGESKAERLRAVNAMMAQDLGLVASSHRDDEMGTVDYVLTNIRREEPPTALFAVPTDYTRLQDATDAVTTEFRPWDRQ